MITIEILDKLQKTYEDDIKKAENKLKSSFIKNIKDEYDIKELKNLTKQNIKEIDSQFVNSSHLSRQTNLFTFWNGIFGIRNDWFEQHKIEINDECYFDMEDTKMMDWPCYTTDVTNILSAFYDPYNQNEDNRDRLESIFKYVFDEDESGIYLHKDWLSNPEIVKKRPYLVGYITKYYPTETKSNREYIDTDSLIAVGDDVGAGTKFYVPKVFQKALDYKGEYFDLRQFSSSELQEIQDTGILIRALLMHEIPDLDIYNSYMDEEYNNILIKLNDVTEDILGRGGKRSAQDNDENLRIGPSKFFNCIQDIEECDQECWWLESWWINWE